MIATLDIASILNGAHELSQTILQSEEVKLYHRSRMELEKDSEAQSLIRSFVKKKEEFEEVERFGKYHPDHDRVKKEMRELKRTMDTNDNVVQYKKAERELESILNEVSKIVAFAVSEDIKIPTGNPFWDQGGCGGSGCGSGGCGSGG
jgi:cell fate (sporulation/competence/biofilm development) regulator YlbF (YheA/YmcA/DUF963 family)